jgi:hypothetical protein
MSKKPGFLEKPGFFCAGVVPKPVVNLPDRSLFIIIILCFASRVLPLLHKTGPGPASGLAQALSRFVEQI